MRVLPQRRLCSVVKRPIGNYWRQLKHDSDTPSPSHIRSCGTMSTVSCAAFALAPNYHSAFEWILIPGFARTPSETVAQCHPSDTALTQEPAQTYAQRLDTTEALECALYCHSRCRRVKWYLLDAVRAAAGASLLTSAGSASRCIWGRAEPRQTDPNATVCRSPAVRSPRKCEADSALNDYV